jgi:hypothetical protein
MPLVVLLDAERDFGLPQTLGVSVLSAKGTCKHADEPALHALLVDYEPAQIRLAVLGPDDLPAGIDASGVIFSTYGHRFAALCVWR